MSKKKKKKKKKKKNSTYIIVSSNCSRELINPAFVSLNHIGIYETGMMDVDDCSDENMSIGEHIKIVTMIHPARPDIYAVRNIYARMHTPIPHARIHEARMCSPLHARMHEAR